MAIQNDFFLLCTFAFYCFLGIFRCLVILSEAKNLDPSLLLRVTAKHFHILTGIPFVFKYLLASGIDISPKWKIEAAKTADALPIATAS